MEYALLVVGSLLAIATALPRVRRQSWWIRVFDFPRLQIAVGLTLCLVLHVLYADTTLGGSAWRATLLVALAVQLRCMRPYSRFVAPQVQQSSGPASAERVRLLSANVLQTNRDTAALLRVVREADPDVVLALETDTYWRDALDALRETHPHALRQPQDNTYGMLLYSRWPLVDPEVRFLIQDDVPSIHAGLRLPSGRVVELHCLHPRPPSPTEADSSVERDAELLIVGRAIKARPGPSIVMGDLNDVAWSHTSHLFRTLSGLLDPRIGRGFFNTFDAQRWWLRFPLDHFFHSTDFRLVDFRRLAAFGSDHFPVFIHLSYEPQASTEQPEPSADAEEMAEAGEKIAKAPAADRKPL